LLNCGGFFVPKMNEHSFIVLEKHHKEWVDIIRKFGEKTYAEDLVQETYIRIYRSNSSHKAVVNGKPNKAFMYITLRNNYLTFVREKSKGHKVDLENIQLESKIESEDNRYIANDVLDELIEDEVNNWHWYDKKLFLLYMNNDISMRSLAKETKISLSSIANTLKNCKIRLRETIGEDYEDYTNKDYHLIMSRKKKNRKNKPKGVGDVEEKVLEKTGISKVAKFMLGVDCGCEDRKEKLNSLFPFRKPECLTEEEYNWLDNWYSLNSSRMPMKEQKEFIKIYNRVFNKKTNTSTCGSCVADKLRQMKKVYNEYV